MPNLKKLAALLVLAASCATASTLSFVGNLDPNDPNSFALFEFVTTTTATLDIQTWGYGGGTNAAGQVIAPGGFDPYVSLFSGFGNSATFVDSNDDGLCPPGNGTVACYDATLIESNLPAGKYTIALTTSGNMSFAENQGSGTLGDGFTGLGNYYDAASDSVRSSAYAIDISSSALVPEPSTLTLLAPFALLVIFTQRNSKAKRENS